MIEPSGGSLGIIAMISTFMCLIGLKFVVWYKKRKEKHNKNLKGLRDNIERLKKERKAFKAGMDSVFKIGENK